MYAYFEVKGVEELETNLLELSNKFSSMVQTMKDVAELIRANTNQRVPLDSGRLEESFNYEIVEQSSELIEVDVIYDAEDPDSGFHYAEIQHKEDFYHPKRGEQYYLLNGLMSSQNLAFIMIKQDYLSLFGGK